MVEVMENEPQAAPVSGAGMAQLIEEAGASAFTDGILFLLAIGKKSWATQLTPEMMGVEKFSENWKPGRCLLLPEAALGRIDRIEGAARRYLEGKSFNFSSQTRHRLPWVREGMADDVLVALSDYEKEYWSAVDKLVEDYEVLKQEMAEKYPQQWPVLSKHYIKSSEIRAHYSFQVITRVMEFPKQFGDADFRAIRRRKDVDAAYKAKSEEAWRKQQEQTSREMREFVEGAARELRSKTIEVFSSFLDARKQNKEINTRSTDSIRKVITWVKEMDFLGDTEFKTRLTDIQQQLESGIEFKNNQAALTFLEAKIKDAVNFANETTEAHVVSASTAYFKRKLTV